MTPGGGAGSDTPLDLSAAPWREVAAGGAVYEAFEAASNPCDIAHRVLSFVPRGGGWVVQFE